MNLSYPAFDSNTKVYKGHDGFRAETYITLDGISAKCANDIGTRRDRPGSSKLCISTGKRHKGLSTFAGVSFHSDDGCIETAIFSDYGQTVAKEPGMRCTEKNVRALHAEVLKLVPAILGDVAKFYAPKELETA